MNNFPYSQKGKRKTSKSIIFVNIIMMSLFKKKNNYKRIINPKLSMKIILLKF